MSDERSLTLRQIDQAAATFTGSRTISNSLNISFPPMPDRKWLSRMLLYGFASVGLMFGALTLWLAR
jgi:hypothetical protein